MRIHCPHCHSRDAYDCWRSRYRMLQADDDVVMTDGGPCACDCHNPDHGSDLVNDALVFFNELIVDMKLQLIGELPRMLVDMDRLNEGRQHIQKWQEQLQKGAVE